MSEPAPEPLRRLEAVAHAHGFSVAAALCVHRALTAGHGMAQFSHPELGGLGQWAGGGMTMIGEMGNPELRRRVDALCVALAAVPSIPDLGRATPGPAAGARGADRGARPGASALGAPPPAGAPAWTAPRVVDAAATDAAATPADPAAPAGGAAARLAGEAARSAAAAPPHPDDPLATIARLAGLRASGILTDQEFAAGKTELLGRL
jgi:hypothetical protein